MNTASTKYDLVQNCKDREYREALNLENVYARICSRIRILREQRNLSQKQFGKVAKMAQERISILEDPNADTKPTLNTLLRLAAALDVGLDVDFVPFSRVIDRSVDTGTDMSGVPSFDAEVTALEQRLADEMKAGSERPPAPTSGSHFLNAALMGQQQFISEESWKDFIIQQQPRLLGDLLTPVSLGETDAATETVAAGPTTHQSPLLVQQSVAVWRVPKRDISQRHGREDHRKRVPSGRSRRGTRTSSKTMAATRN